MTILLIALFAVMFVLYIINIRTNSQYEKLESLKANPLDVINNLCLTKTRKFIGTKKQYYCYYNFIITNEFLILERNPNAAILKELPILIIRNPNYTEITSYKNIFKIDTRKRNEKHALVLELSNIKTNEYKIKLDFNQPEPSLEKWIIE